MHGILNVRKPAGMTSHDVVQAARRITGEKRIGHTGTLDPLATGVLVLCVGQATRIAQYLEAGEKEYQAVMRLGTITDTLDADGRILETRSYTPPARSRLLSVLQTFTGSIMQQPPAFSAIKVAGVASYRLARLGKARPLMPRPVTIFSIELTGCDDPIVSITVKCSKGVYIRSLCSDIGEALGSGAHLTALQRTRSGRFCIESSFSLDQLVEFQAEGTLEKMLISIDDALADFPVVRVNRADAVKISHGNRISAPGADEDYSVTPLRIHDPSGVLLAVARSAGRGEIRPELVFCQ